MKRLAPHPGYPNVNSIRAIRAYGNWLGFAPSDFEEEDAILQSAMLGVFV
jgi:hypothetical protein